MMKCDQAFMLAHEVKVCANTAMAWGFPAFAKELEQLSRKINREANRLTARDQRREGDGDGR